jgi:small GTP-binding protein
MISPPPYQHQHQQPHQPDQHQQQQPQHQPQQSQKHQHPQQQQLPPIKLQFLVLGAAGAGKTSILRRYFYKTFQAGARVPTIGSDFYTGRVPCPPVPVPASASENNSEQNQQPPPQQQQQEVQIRLQMWDTPGRERRQKYETSLSDSFFRQAHAIMLVYDMTSSTSFTQLLAWYADLMILRNERFLPVMIVANKLDIFQSDKDRAPHYPQRTQQRDVLGLRGGFRGKDFRYEYRVSTSPVNNNNNNAQQQSVPTQLTRSGSNNSSSKRMEISSYLANRENWTTDGSYLESVRTLLYTRNCGIRCTNLHGAMPWLLLFYASLVLHE